MAEHKSWMLRIGRSSVLSLWLTPACWPSKLQMVGGREVYCSPQTPVSSAMRPGSVAPRSRLAGTSKSSTTRAGTMPMLLETMVTPHGPFPMEPKGLMKSAPAPSGSGTQDIMGRTHRQRTAGKPFATVCRTHILQVFVLFYAPLRAFAWPHNQLLCSK